MTSELHALVWAALLGLVHILAAAQVRTRQYGLAWNAGARDAVQPKPSPLAGRLARAQDNFFETFPLFVAAVLVVYLADLETDTTLIAAWGYLAARVAYLPLYAAGVPYVRSVVWLTAMAALVTLLAQPLLA